MHKPDLLAPAIWLPAPMLPGTLTAREAAPLFQLLSVLEEAWSEYSFSETRQVTTPEEKASVQGLIEAIEARISRSKYISPDYQHVDGTSFASPIIASVAAQMLEANPKLTPADCARASTRPPCRSRASRARGKARAWSSRGRAVEWAIARR